MALIPLTLRKSFQEEHSSDVEIALVTINHPDLDAPLRVSSDPTSRLSVDPLRYGTISRGQTYEFILMSALIPDDRKGSPPRTAIVLDNVASDIVAVARSFTSPAIADIELVLASAPDFVVQAFRNLRIVRCSYDIESVTFDLAKEPFTTEPFGARQTKQFFPGLFGIAAS